jgi:hypothetical protein
VKESVLDGTVGDVKRLVFKIDESVTWEDYFKLFNLL